MQMQLMYELPQPNVRQMLIIQGMDRKMENGKDGSQRSGIPKWTPQAKLSD